MTLLSVCVITRDGECSLERCLASAAFADEIVVVDSGSTDRTVEIAKRFTDRVYHRQFPGYGPQKEFCFSLARGEWILSLDADETVSPLLQHEIQETVRDPAALNGYSLRRKNYIGNIQVRFGGPFRNAPDCTMRLFRKEWGSIQGGIVDEKIEVNGLTSSLHGFLDHHVAADMEKFSRKMNFKAGLKALDLYRKGRRRNALVRKIAGIVRPAMTFIRQLLLRGAFLQGTFGFRMARAQSGFTRETCRSLDGLYKRYGKEVIPKETEQAILTPKANYFSQPGD